jgi:hypothetical protein
MHLTASDAHCESVVTGTSFLGTVGAEGKGGVIRTEVGHTRDACEKTLKTGRSQ